MFEEAFVGIAASTAVEAVVNVPAGAKMTEIVCVGIMFLGIYAYTTWAVPMAGKIT
jgi:hypothetical protein